MKELENVHPGEVLYQEFLVPMNLSQNAIARAIGVAPRRINEIVLGRRAVTADTALRLAKAFGTTPEFWMNLQASYDLEEAGRSLGAVVERIEAVWRRRSAWFRGRGRGGVIGDCGRLARSAIGADTVPTDADAPTISARPRAWRLQAIQADAFFGRLQRDAGARSPNRGMADRGSDRAPMRSTRRRRRCA